MYYMWFILLDANLLKKLHLFNKKVPTTYSDKHFRLF